MNLFFVPFLTFTFVLRPDGILLLFASKANLLRVGEPTKEKQKIKIERKCMRRPKSSAN